MTPDSAWAAEGKAGSRRGSAPRRAERIFRGAWIWPGAPGGRSEPAPAFVGDLAVAQGEILGLGPREEVEPLAGPDTEIVDLRGRFVFPGFQDAHAHLLTGGFKLDGLDLREADSRESFTAGVAERARALPPGRWILGGEWDHQRWGGALPHRDWIDEVTPHHPAILNRIDMHVALANGRALEAAGIGSHTPDPPGGTIDRDGEGRPTGILREAAIQEVWARIPTPTEAEWRRALGRACRYLLSRGITQVHDMGVMERSAWSWQALDTLQEARDAGALPLRVRTALPVKDWERLAARVAEEGPGDPRLRWDAVKAFGDGSLGARTAWFHERYRDHPGSGGPLEDPEGLARQVRDAVGAGLRPVVHAIGDRANDWILDLYLELLAGSREDGHRAALPLPFRVEHAQHLTPRALRQASTPGIVLSMQPAHLVEDGPWLLEALGSERAGRAYAFRSLLAGGASIAFGSDWTVVPAEPLAGMAAAAGRRVRGAPEGAPEADGGIFPDARGVFCARERIGAREALRAYTAGAADAVGESGRQGSLAPGKAADLTVLTRDPLDAPPQEIPHAEVEMAVVAGEVCYRRGDGS